jgi:hypothetical protein
MTARQFLLSESSYCRRRAERCPDPFLAEELRRLAECFEQTANAVRSGSITAEAAQEQDSH